MVISSDIQELTQQEAFAAGASAFLPKMETQPIFLNAIDVLLGEERLLDLSAAERDVFSELTNRAMGQAARAIESLLDRRVQLVVPEIRIMGLEDFKVFLKREGFHDGTVIQQGFSGERHGHAYLLFGRYQAQIFINTLLSEKREINGLSNTDQTVLNEVGNMVLNAAISIIGDQLKTRLAMSFPTVFIKLGHDQLSETLSASYGTTDRAVVLVSHLRIGDTDITCYLALIVSESTVRHLLDSMKLLDTG
jgi:chemotaxis protein CheC